MTSNPSWAPQAPALTVWTKYAIGSPLSPENAFATGGALTPDVQPNSPPSFPAALPPEPELAGTSLLKIGNYVLTERLPDTSPGIAIYRALNELTCEELVCRILPLERCHASLTPFWSVGPHPHINGVHEVIMGSTSAYAMHRTGPTPAEDLHAYVRRRRRLPEGEASQLFAQALQAVAHCHRSGVVVRDIKLRRFIFSDTHRTILQLDGLYDAVVFHNGDDRLADKHGCLAYVSPEILDATFVTGVTTETAASARQPIGSGSYAGCAADMWSLGVMLYTMLVGQYPFADTDACSLFARIRRGRYSLPSEISLSSHARCLIRSLLAVNPSDRITAEEALQHPWFSTAKLSGLDHGCCGEPVFPLPAAVAAAEDRTVPELMDVTTDKFFTD
jgi:tribbles-like protein